MMIVFENWLVFEDWFIWVALAISIVGSIFAGLFLDYCYRKDRDL